MTKKLALFFLLLTAPAFSQGVGGGGVPGGPGSGGGQSSTVATLPAGANLVYSFIATGDQAGSTIHDISGSGNSVTTTYNVSPWTGTGWTLSNGSNTGVYVVLPAAITSDYSYCATVYLPYFTNPAGNSNAVYALKSSTNYFGWSFTTQYGGNDFVSTYGQWSRWNSFSGAVAPEESGLHTKCWVQGRSANSTSDQFYQDGVNDTAYGGTGSGDSVTGQWYLSAQSSGQSTAVWYYFAAWPIQLTAAQVQQASFAMTQAVAARGVPTQPSTTPTQTVKLIGVGDSITCCGGAATTTWWPSLVSVSSTYGTAVNEGIGGYPVMCPCRPSCRLRQMHRS